MCTQVRPDRSGPLSFRRTHTRALLYQHHGLALLELPAHADQLEEYGQLAMRLSFTVIALGSSASAISWDFWRTSSLVESIYSCSARCSKHGICRDGACHCDHGWTGTSCGTSECPDPGCSNHGVCTKGACVCDTGFYGPTCSDGTHPTCPERELAVGCNDDQCQWLPLRSTEVVCARVT